MKVLLVIDHFGSGGAQRQIVELACGLKRRGRDVEMFVYHPQHGFFRPRLDDYGIPVHQYSKGSGFSVGVIRELSGLMRAGGFDVVVSYLSDANIYAELSKLVSSRPVLIVSERTSHHDDKSWFGDHARRLLHMLSDHVVANSSTHAEWLIQKSWLKGKVSCIYNGIDLDQVDPDPRVPDSIQDMRLVAIGRVGPEKNVINLIRALALFHEASGCIPQVDWIGPRDTSNPKHGYGRAVDQLLESLPEVKKRWNWLGVRSDVPQLLRERHALVHPSLYEGLPNVVCEALAAGKPVLVSNVCDHPRLVADGERGFLFDAQDPASIADAITKLCDLDTDGWHRFSRNARDYAVANLGIERMVTDHETLFTQLLGQGVHVHL